MKLFFNMEYRSAFGERLSLNILDEKGHTTAHEMHTNDGAFWTCELDWKGEPGTFFDYYYSVLKDKETVRHEWLVEPHRLVQGPNIGTR